MPNPGLAARWTKRLLIKLEAIMGPFDDYNEFCDVTHNQWEQYWLDCEAEESEADD